MNLNRTNRNSKKHKNYHELTVQLMADLSTPWPHTIPLSPPSKHTPTIPFQQLLCQFTLNSRSHCTMFKAQNDYRQWEGEVARSFMKLVQLSECCKVICPELHSKWWILHEFPKEGCSFIELLTFCEDTMPTASAIRSSSQYPSTLPTAARSQVTCQIASTAKELSLSTQISVTLRQSVTKKFPEDTVRKKFHSSVWARRRYSLKSPQWFG